MSSIVSSQAIAIYTQLLDAWNRQDADAFAALFAPDAHVTGFDGSQMIGPGQIASELREIFAHHQTASYVAKVREVRTLDPTVAILHADAGMIPPGTSALNPAVNAIQTLVLTAGDDSSTPRIAHFQNTPAAFHGRPRLVDAMTEELTRVYETGHTVAAD